MPQSFLCTIRLAIAKGEPRKSVCRKASALAAKFCHRKERTMQIWATVYYNSKRNPRLRLSGFFRILRKKSRLLKEALSGLIGREQKPSAKSSDFAAYKFCFVTETEQQWQERFRQRNFPNAITFVRFSPSVPADFAAIAFVRAGRYATVCSLPARAAKQESLTSENKRRFLRGIFAPRLLEKGLPARLLF